MHLVHQDPLTGKLAVIGVLLEDTGAVSPDAAWDQLVADLPTLAHPHETVAGPFNAEDLLPANRKYYTYSGSLTTPPASEIVNWLMLEEPVKLTPAQIAAFETAIADHNNRPVQDLNDRMVTLDTT